MKKIFILLCVLVSVKFTLKAQPFVPITDPVWANYLTTNYPTCMTGNTLNGGCPALGIPNTLNLSGMGLTNIAGIQYFSNVWSLNVSNNALTVLPQLANSVYSLVANNNSLTTITNFPPSCQYIYVQNNQLSYLPPAGTPTGLTLYCGNNNITCFGNFPVNSQTLDLLPNPVVCLPNYAPLAMNGILLAMPICSVGNIYNCAGANAVSGSFYKDMNGNCAKDNADVPVKGVGVKAYDNSGVLLSQYYSNINNNYSLAAPLGTVNVRFDTAGGAMYIPQCPIPGYDSTNIVLTMGTPSINNVNFNLTCPSGFDIGCIGACVGTTIFPGQPFKMKPHAGAFGLNGLACAAGVSGQVIISFSGPVNILGPYPGSKIPALSAGNSFTYNIADFGNFPIFSDSLRLALVTQTSAVIGNVICMNVTVLPNIGDNNLTNNTYSTCVVVGNSYDPNIKHVTPGDVLPGYNGWFNYEIQFQNLGNASAYNIRILDTLDNNLDLSTFQVVGSKHPCNVTVNGNKANFFFPNIMLPDSTSDPIGSISVIQYRVKPKAGMVNGSKIKNRAHIYFDYNPAVITNQTINNFIIPTQLNNRIVSGTSISIYPNPGKGKYTFVSDVEDRYEIEVYNALGAIVKAVSFNGKEKEMNIEELSNGIYLFVVKQGSGSIKNVKVIKE